MMDLEGAVATIKNKDNAETFDRSVHSLQAIVDNLLASGTFGLAALKTLIDAIAADMGDGSYGLAALETIIVDIESKLDDGTTGLPALKALLDILGSELGSGTYGLAVLKVILDAVAARLDNGTSGLIALKNLLDSVQAKLDKLAGEAPVSGSVTSNWQSGTATSGETGANVVTIGANDTRKRLHSLLLSIHNFQTSGQVTVRMFMQVNGTERKVYQEQFNKGNDPDGCWIVNGTVGIHEALRVELQSNKVADNGVALHYDCMPEAM